MTERHLIAGRRGGKTAAMLALRNEHLLEAFKEGAQWGFDRKYPGLFPSDAEILGMLEKRAERRRPS